MRRHCSYPGHSNANQCSPGRFIVESPPDRLGRTRRMSICAEALTYARARGYILLGESR